MFEFELRPEQRPVPLPVLTRFLALAQTSSEELTRLVNESLETNPALDRIEGRPCPSCGRWLSARWRRCRSCAGISVAPLDPEPETMAAPRNWRSALTDDVCLECTHPRFLVEAVVAHLDRHGFLPEPVSDIARRLGADVGTVEEVLALVRLVGQPGVGARDAVESIRLQCCALVDAGVAPAALVAMVEGHLDLLAAGDTALLAERLRRPVREIIDAIAILKTRVCPYPLLDESPARLPPADIVIRIRPDTGQPEVEVADTAWFGLVVAPVPAGGEAWLAPHRRDARDLMQGLDGRASLLRRIAIDVVIHQRTFILDGTGHQPISRVGVATRLGVHPSTVGRAVRDKWMRCPDGRLLAVRRCFDQALGPKEVLAELLTAYPRASDRELSILAADRGLTMARRTVAKYRASIRVPARYPKPGSPPTTIR